MYMSSLLMSQHHFVYVLGGMEIDKVHILMVQPRTILISSNCPSAMSFFEDMLSTLSISFEQTRGRANVGMVRGTAVEILLVLSAISGAIMMLSSISTPNLPKSLGRIMADNSLTG